MARLGMILTAAIATLLLVTPAQAAKRRKPAPCTAKGSHTIKSTRDLRVWSERTEDDDGEYQLAFHGCLRRLGRVVDLVRTTGNEVDGGTDVVSVKVAGRQVAFVEVTDTGCSRYDQCPVSDPDGISATVTAVDLRRPRKIRAVALSDPPSAYAVTQRGGLAVLAGNALLAVDATGRRQLDTGKIDRRTLRAEISIVSWVRDGVERFARLR